jgi:IPT/TIG domain/Bacterial Ig-like domain (group 3)/Glucodextranase, domain B
MQDAACGSRNFGWIRSGISVLILILAALVTTRTALAAAPTISSFSPTSGPVGTAVTITGTNFSSTPANNSVKFNGTAAATPTSATTTKLMVTVPLSATTGKITITVGSSTGTSSGSFTVSPPTITSFSPTSGPAGTPVTITGTNFSTTLVNNVVKFNGTTATPTSATTTKIVVPVPLAATTGKITVAVGALTATSGSSFTVSPPTITGVSPASGPVGTAVTITGTNFSATSANDVVKFNGTTAMLTSATATQIVVPVPSGSTTGKVTVTIGALTATSGSNFTVTVPPTITSFSPASGPVGTSVTINGTNFSSTASQDTVKFNGVAAAAPTSPTTTRLVVKVPSSAATGPISVIVSGLTATSSTNFTVTPVPTVSGLNPSSGVFGTPVTITGTNFDSNPANDTVTFNGTTSTPTSASATQLVAVVPSAATTGKISVTVAGLTGTSGSSFTVPSPTITGTNPGSGPAGTSVTISGTNFSPVATDNVVTFHGTGASVTSSTSTQIVATVPTGATTGTIKVTVGSHSVTSGSSFTVTQAPTISGFTPAFGRIGTDVEIVGTNFSTNQANDIVAFTGVAGSPVQIGPTTTALNAIVPTGGTTGPISITVNGTGARSATNFTYVPGDLTTAPGIDGFLPTSGAPGTVVAVHSSGLGHCCWNSIAFNGVQATVAARDGDEVFVVVPTGATTGPISIIYNALAATSTTNFTVVPTGPVISGFSPTAAVVGSTLTIVGSNFATTAAANTVTINGVAATVTSAAANQLAVTVPSGAITGFIKVTTSGNAATSVVPVAVIVPDSTVLTADGVSAQSSTTAPGQSLAFTFSGAAGQNLGLAISGLTLIPSVSSTTVTLTAPGGSTIATSSCAAGCTLGMSNLPSNGIYTATINPNATATVGAVATLTSQITGSVAMGTQLNLNLTRLGQIARIGFTANAGDSFALEFANIWGSPAEVLQFKVLRPDGTQLAPVVQSDGGKAVLPLLHLPLTGSYTVIVEPITAAPTTSLQIALVPPVPITVGGANVAQDTNQAGQTGLLSFSATAGQSLDLHIDGNSSPLNPVVYAPDGSVISPLFEPNYDLGNNGYTPAQYADCGANTSLCRLNLIAPVTGTYLVVIQSPFFNYEPGAAFAAYLIGTATSSIAADGTARSLSFAANQSNRLTFNGTAAQSLQLQWGAISFTGLPTGFTPSPAPTIVVINPDGSPLTWFGLANGGNGGSLLATGGAASLPVLPSTGVYTILVDPTPDTLESMTLTLTTVAAGTCTESDGSLVAQTNLSISPNPVTVGGTYSVTATESDCNHTTGTVNVYDDLGDSCAINTASPTACSFPAPQGGKHRVAATYQTSTGAFFSKSSSTVVVASGTSTLTLGLQVVPDPSVPGDYIATVTATPNPPATAQPTGVVSIVGGCRSSLPNPQACVGNITSGNSTTLTAQYFGDANYAPAVSPSVAYTNPISLPTTTSIASVEPEPSDWLYPFTITVAVNSPFEFGTVPTGSVTVTGGFEDIYTVEPTCTVYLPEQNSCSIQTSGFYVATTYVTAKYSGDAVYASSSASSHAHGLVMKSASSVVVASVATEPSAVGQSYQVTATVIPVSTTTATPTGNVTIADGTNSCTFTLPATGCLISDSTPGTVSLLAEYGGDANFAGAVSTPVSHAVSSPGGPGAIPPRHEVCGFDPNTTYSMPSGFVAVSQLPGAVISPGIDASILGEPVVTITFPPPNAQSYDTTVDVVGTVAGPLNTGVTVNGIVVPVINGWFAIASLPLAPGNNGFTVTATTLTGLTSTAVTSVGKSGGNDLPISIQVTSPLSTGFAPFSVSYTYTIGTLLSNATVKSIAIDLDGDGTPDFSGTSLSGAPTSFTFNAPGLYTPTLTVVDSNNVTYTADTQIVVQDYVQTRGMLCDVYGYLKDRLNEGDAAGAVLAYQASVQSAYSSLFTDPGANLPSMVPMLGIIANGFIGQGYAEMTIVRDNANQTRNGYPLRMTQGTDGVWRIGEM